MRRKKLRYLKLEKIYTQTKETKISKKQHIFQQSELSNDDFCKKIGHKGAETSSFKKVNSRILACTLVYQFSNVLSEKTKRDTSAKGGSQVS